MLKQDMILTREAGWEGGFLGLRNKGGGGQSKTLVIAPKGTCQACIRQASGHQSVSEAKIWGLGLRWGTIQSGMGLLLASPEQEMRRQSWLELKAAG